MKAPSTLKATALACLIGLAGAATQAAPISGIWRTTEGTYLMTVRDASAVVVGVELGADLKVRDIYTGTRLREPLSVLALGDAQKQISIDTITDTTLSGTRSGGQVFSATRFLGYKDAGINGIWKRDDGQLGYLFVFNGEGENGGTGIVSEIFFKDGQPQHLLALGKITGNGFADTTTGYRLLLQSDGKLAGEYGNNPRDNAQTLEPGITDARSVSRATTTASSTSGTYTATRVLTGKDPEVGAGTGGTGTGGIGGGTGGIGGIGGGGTGTTPEKGCTGNFGSVQTAVKDALAAKMTERGLSAGWIVSKTKIGDVKVFDGGTVPNYRITYVSDASSNLNKTLAKGNPAQSIFVECTTATGAGTDIVASVNSYGTTSGTASTFCSSVKTSAADLAANHAGLSARGMNAEDVTFNATDTSSITSGKVALTASIYIDVDGSYSLPSSLTHTDGVRPVTTGNEAYTRLLSACKSWYSSSDGTPASTYPAWYGSKPYATPEFGICIDPNNNIGHVPGMFAVDIRGGGTSETGHAGEPFVRHTSEIDLSTVVPYQFTSSDPETGQTQIMVTRVPIHLLKSGATSADVLDPQISATCYFDKEAELWFGAGGIEPHTEACKAFNTQFRDQFRQNAYDGLYVTKTDITFPNGDVMNLTPAEGLSVGMAMMAGAGLGALGIGAFEPTGNVTSSNVGLDVSSTAKFISLTPYVTTTPTQSCYTIPADPQTGEPAEKVCETYDKPNPVRQVAYTIEAPSCEP